MGARMDSGITFIISWTSIIKRLERQIITNVFGSKYIDKKKILRRKKIPTKERQLISKYKFYLQQIWILLALKYLPQHSSKLILNVVNTKSTLSLN